MTSAPLSNEEVDALFLPLLRYKRLVLAVSGGADSSALLHLAAAWRTRCSGAPALIVVTVDHGLRNEAAGEAAKVGQWATSFGLPHHTLRWSGPKPATGLQAAARNARYNLLLDAALGEAHAVVGACEGDAPTAIVTAHTADDQAETLIMRLARGSGVDGLAAIPPLGRYARQTPSGLIETIAIARPLLAVSRERLMATLTAAGIPFVDDPSNRDPRFERVRVRDALGLLEDLGVTRSALTRTAARLRSARAALDDATDRLTARAVSRIVEVVSVINRDLVAREPDEIGVRLLRRVLAGSGGAATPAELSAIEDLYQRLFRGAGTAVATSTLGGSIIETELRGSTDGSRILVYREPDRGSGLPVLPIVPGHGALWDNRVWASVAKEHPVPVELGPLGADWQSLFDEYGLDRPQSVPIAALRGLPAFRQLGQILAVPMLAAHAQELGNSDAARRLAGPTSGTSQPDLQAHIWRNSMPDMSEP